MWEDNWPGKTRMDGADTGIDLVAQQTDGSLCAIQCKFYKGQVDTGDVDSFLAASSRKEFQSRVLIHTGTGVQHHGLGKLKHAHPPCDVFDVARMGKWNADWWKLAERSRAVAPGTPRRRVHDRRLSGPVAPARAVFRMARRYWASVGGRWRKTAEEGIGAAARLGSRAWLLVESLAVTVVTAALFAAGIALAAVLLLLTAAAAAASKNDKRGGQRKR